MDNKELEFKGFPLRIPALKVIQPFGEFYVCTLEATLISRLIFSNPLRYTDESGTLVGGQRKLDEDRCKEIASYIQTVDAAFPNSIIIAANYDEAGDLHSNPSECWSVELLPGNNEMYCINIPTEKRLASIIDGQHRIKGFYYAPETSQNMQMLCAIYLDLPNSYQASLFATINGNQKKIDRSLAYEHFGYNLDDEKNEAWSPEKLAVALCRKIKQDDSSLFYKRIINAPQNSQILQASNSKEMGWRISTATIVDGIVKLFSSNPKRDMSHLHKMSLANRSRSKLKEISETSKDKSPFRSLYLEPNDLAIYTAIKNYFEAAKDVFFTQSDDSSYIKKTVGIQALFDVLRNLAPQSLERKDISVSYYKQQLEAAASINFSDAYFQASGIGRSRIKSIILYANGLLPEDEKNAESIEEYKRLLNKTTNH